MSSAVSARRRFRTPRLLLVLLAVLLVLGGGYYGMWRWAEWQMDSGFQRLAAAGRAQGWRLQSGPPAPGASPGHVSLIVPQPMVEGGEADIPGGLAWQAERMVIAVSPLHPRVLGATAEGREVLRLSLLPPIPFEAGQLWARVPLWLHAMPEQMDLHARDLHTGLPGGQSATDGLAVGGLDVHADWAGAPGAKPAIAVLAHAVNVALRSGDAWPFGQHLEDFTADTVMVGGWPAGTELAAQATAWQQAGGVLKLRHVALAWGRLRLTGSGEVRLDPNLQPVGAGTARLVDPQATLKALVAQGVISRRAALAVGAVLGLLEQQPEEGGPPVVDLPVSVQDRTLSVARIPVMRLPALVWPAQQP